MHQANKLITTKCCSEGATKGYVPHSAFLKVNWLSVKQPLFLTCWNIRCFLEGKLATQTKISWGQMIDHYKLLSESPKDKDSQVIRKSVQHMKVELKKEMVWRETLLQRCWKWNVQQQQQQNIHSVKIFTNRVDRKEGRTWGLEGQYRRIVTFCWGL